eukprot:gene11628-13578_t
MLSMLTNSSTPLTDSQSAQKTRGLGGSNSLASSLKSRQSNNHNKKHTETSSTVSTAAVDHDTYVTCERYRIATLANEQKWEVVEERCTLREYRLYAVEEWIFKSGHLWSAVEYTGISSDQILVSVVKPSASLSVAAAKPLLTMLSKPPTGSFYTIRTPLGQLMLANSSVSSLNLVKMPDGDFEKHIDTLKLNLSLKRLGCMPPRYQLTTAQHTDADRQLFADLSGATKTNLSTVTNFVKEVQAALSHLNYLPLLTKIDGQYDQKTINAVKAFQIDYKKRNSKDPQTIEGYIDLATFKGIEQEIFQLKKKLESLGFRTPERPIKNYLEFTQLMKTFQDTYGVYPEAPGKNILSYLEHIHKTSHIPSYQLESDQDDDESDGGHSEKSIQDTCDQYFSDDMYEYLETSEEAEEKQKLKKMITQLEDMMDVQQLEYNKLKQEFEDLSNNYSELKEQSSRSIAIVSTNEKLFQEISHRWSKIMKKDLPEIEEKITLNDDTIQSYSNRIRRYSSVAFAYLIMFISLTKRKIYPSSKPPSSSQDDIKRFISNQKLKISELIEDLDDTRNDQTENNNSLAIIPVFDNKQNAYNNNNNNTPIKTPYSQSNPIIFGDKQQHIKDVQLLESTSSTPSDYKSLFSNKPISLSIPQSIDLPENLTILLAITFWLALAMFDFAMAL